MNIDQIIVIIGGIGLIGFTYWFFLGKKEKAVDVSDSVDITVRGGYSPSTIVLQKGKKTKINFKRLDSSSCLEEVVLSDFKVKKFLPLKQKVTIEITPEKEGEYNFSCGMNMFHGKVIVRE
jgi:plastocyanin domain-containing protein